MSNSRNDVRQRSAHGGKTETYILPDVFVVFRFGHRADGKRSRKCRSSKGHAPDRIYGNRHFRHARRHIATGIQEPGVGWTYARFLYFNTIICLADGIRRSLRNFPNGVLKPFPNSTRPEMPENHRRRTHLPYPDCRPVYASVPSPGHTVPRREMSRRSETQVFFFSSSM